MTILVVVSANATYAAWAFSSPMRPVWMYYVELEIPPAVASANAAGDVAARLRLAGYDATIDTTDGLTILNATTPSDPDIRAQVSGLGRDSWGVMWVELQCRVAYLRSDCPDEPEVLLRSRLDGFVRDSGLPLDVSLAFFGDWDFATGTESFKLMGQHLLLIAAGILIAVVAILEAVIGRERRHVDEAVRPPP